MKLTKQTFQNRQKCRPSEITGIENHLTQRLIKENYALKN